MILGSKEMELKNITLRAMKQELELKLSNVSEKPLDILKRLDKFADQPIAQGGGESAKGMFCNAVIVRVFNAELKIMEDERKEQ
jgi:hypothetical protein